MSLSFVSKHPGIIKTAVTSVTTTSYYFPFERIPPEILQHVASFLDAEAFGCLRLASRYVERVLFHSFRRRFFAWPSRSSSSLSPWWDGYLSRETAEHNMIDIRRKILAWGVDFFPVISHSVDKNGDNNNPFLFTENDFSIPMPEDVMRPPEDILWAKVLAASRQIGLCDFPGHGLQSLVLKNVSLPAICVLGLLAKRGVSKSSYCDEKKDMNGNLEKRNDLESCLSHLKTFMVEGLNLVETRQRNDFLLLRDSWFPKIARVKEKIVTVRRRDGKVERYQGMPVDEQWERTKMGKWEMDMDRDAWDAMFSLLAAFPTTIDDAHMSLQKIVVLGGSLTVFEPTGQECVTFWFQWPHLIWESRKRSSLYNMMNNEREISGGKRRWLNDMSKGRRVVWKEGGTRMRSLC